MYRNSLFSRGAKNITKYQLRTGNKPIPYHSGGSCCGSGVASSAKLDNYLLSLIGGIGRMSVKPKRTGTKRRGGGALKFIR
jgi:hypothetical protein